MSTNEQQLTTSSSIAEPNTDNDNDNGNRGDPGASRRGNFINYYQFHSAEERVRQLPLSVVSRGAQISDGDRSVNRKYVALDVGCNAGNLTLELHKYLSDNLPNREVKILGVDVDPILIERARERNDRPDSVTFECLDFLSDDRETVVKAFLDKHQATRFDASFCFSITMWIHLNAGDAGLEEFLGAVCACSDSVLVEPQPWKCYRNASRRLRRAEQDDFPLLKVLKYRTDVEEHIERIILESGFYRIEVSERNDWQRKLIYFGRTRFN